MRPFTSWPRAAVLAALTLVVPATSGATARAPHGVTRSTARRTTRTRRPASHTTASPRATNPRPVAPLAAASPSTQPSSSDPVAPTVTAIGPDLRELQFRGAGGGIEVQNDAHHFTDVDGGRLRVRVSDETSTRQTWAVVGGMVRLTTGGYASIDRGELYMERRGRSWALAGGTLQPVRASEQRAGHAVVESPVPVNTAVVVPAVDPAASGNQHDSGPAVLPARTLAALDRLLSLAPAGSRDAIRLASATEVTIRNAQSANPSLFATPIVGHSVVLVIDTSYSMRDRDPAATDASIDPTLPPTKLDVAKAELVHMLASLAPGTLVNILAFSAETVTLWTAPRALDDDTLDEAIRWVSALAPGDVTDPLPALRAADAMHPDQVVFVTDGRPTDREVDDDALLALAAGIATRTARLDIVGIGRDQDVSFLDRVAARGGGVARHR